MNDEPLLTFRFATEAGDFPATLFADERVVGHATSVEAMRALVRLFRIEHYLRSGTH